MNLFSYKNEDIHLEHKYDAVMNNNNCSYHTHSNVELFYLMQGDAKIYIEGNVYRIAKDDIILIRPNESHYFEINSDTPYERIVINFEPNIFSSLDNNEYLTKFLTKRKSGQQTLFTSSEFNIRAFSQYFTNMINEKSNTKLNILSNLLVILFHMADFSEPIVETPDSENFENNILKYIDDHIETQLDIDKICRQFFISRSKLSKIIKQTTGLTPWEYIITKRLIKAKSLINAGYPLTKVYELCGFSNYSTFYRSYLKYFKEFPSSQKPSKDTAHSFSVSSYTITSEPFDANIFKSDSTSPKMLHVVSNARKSNVIQKTAILEKSKTYTASFKLKTITGVFNWSFYFMVNIAQFTVDMSKNYGKILLDGRHPKEFISITKSDNGWLSFNYTFSLKDLDDVGIVQGKNKIDLGFYIEKKVCEFYFADFTVYETTDENKTNLLVYPDDSRGVYGWHSDFYTTIKKENEDKQSK